MKSATWTEEEVERFRRRMLAWYRKNARDLPWRRTHDAYRVWVSEVMLQQTRVVTVVERYTQFIRRFPSLVSLALAEEEEVLAFWSGLGYYKRARLLHEAARLLVSQHGGSLPKSSAELRRLPGVGDYTSAAVASIAYGEPVPAIDGNVERVVIRLMRMASASGRFPATLLRDTANRLLDPEHPGTFNQAMMELGATVCLPRAPLCTACPVEDFCGTRGEHATRPRKQILSRRANYALIRKPDAGQGSHGAVLLVRRPSDARQMPGMWELPLLLESFCTDCEPVLRVRHAITRTNYYVEVFAIERRESAAQAIVGPDEKWVAVQDLDDVPLTGLARKILMRLGILARPRQVHSKKILPGAGKELL